MGFNSYNALEVVNHAFRISDRSKIGKGRKSGKGEGIGSWKRSYAIKSVKGKPPAR